MPPLSFGHCWLVQIEIVGGPLCQPVQSTCSEELLKVGVLYLPCAVAYNPIRNTAALLGSPRCVSSFCKQEKKEKITHRTKQRNKAWHLIFRYS